MSRPRFLADNDLNDHIVKGVLRREPLVDFPRAREVAMDRRLDPAVLEYAASNELIVVSHDVQTMSGYAIARVAAGQRMAGLLLIPQAEPIAPMIESLLMIWAATEAEEWEGKMEFLPI